MTLRSATFHLHPVFVQVQCPNRLQPGDASCDVQVPSQFIILKDVVVEPQMEGAAKSFKFSLANPSRQIVQGVTTIWEKRTQFHAKRGMKFAVLPGAVIAKTTRSRRS